MSRNENDKEKTLYRFALECAKNGIDLEKTLGNIFNLAKDVFEQVYHLTNKNYEFLKKGFENETIRNKK